MRLSLSEIRTYEATRQRVGFVVCGRSLGKGDRFSGWTKTGRHITDARVLDIDLSGVYPIETEFIGPDGELRHERFRPAEFASIAKETMQ